MLNRRSLLTLVAGAAASGTLPARENAPSISDPVLRWMVINSCGGFDDSTDIRRTLPGSADPNPAIKPQVIRDALESGMTAANQTVGYMFGNQDPYEQTVKEVAWWDAMIRNDPQLLKVYSAADIRRAKSEHRLGLILGFQNAAMIGQNVDRLDTFVDLGIRIIQLTYNNQNLLGGGALTPRDPGLTPLGRAAVERLNARRAIVDLAHSGAQTCLDASRASRQPVAISHTGCRALVDHPRNTDDQALRLVADHGGYIGIYFMPYLAIGRDATAQDVLAHLDHAINVCGEDHVGIGTDGGTSPIDMNAYRIESAKENAQRHAAGIAAPGESATTLTFIPELSGPSQFRILTKLMRLHGYRETLIEKLLGLNFLAFAREVWGS